MPSDREMQFVFWGSSKLIIWNAARFRKHNNIVFVVLESKEIQKFQQGERLFC